MASDKCLFLILPWPVELLFFHMFGLVFCGLSSTRPMPAIMDILFPVDTDSDNSPFCAVLIVWIPYWLLNLQCFQKSQSKPPSRIDCVSEITDGYDLARLKNCRIVGTLFSRGRDCNKVNEHTGPKYV